MVRFGYQLDSQGKSDSLNAENYVGVLTNSFVYEGNEQPLNMIYKYAPDFGAPLKCFFNLLLKELIVWENVLKFLIRSAGIGST